MKMQTENTNTEKTVLQ